MENNMQIYKSEKFGEIRTLNLNGEPWFAAVDVCIALDLSNPTIAVSRLDEDERAKFNLGRQGNATIVNEPGLYTLILSSRKPEAKAFKRWIAHEVIPSIRKQWQMDDLCRALLGAVRKFYESEENVKKFQEWKQARERRRKEENNEH